MVTAQVSFRQDIQRDAGIDTGSNAGNDAEASGDDDDDPDTDAGSLVEASKHDQDSGQEY